MKGNIEEFVCACVLLRITLTNKSVLWAKALILARCVSCDTLPKSKTCYVCKKELTEISFFIF